MDIGLSFVVIAVKPFLLLFYKEFFTDILNCFYFPVHFLGKRADPYAVCCRAYLNVKCVYHESSYQVCAITEFRNKKKI